MALRLYLLGSVCSVLLAAPFVGAGVIHVPSDYATIDEAVIAAIEGDSVLVAPGTYPERVNFRGKGIVVEATDGPDVTVIDGEGRRSCVVFWNGETRDARLVGFTLQGGWNIDGGAVHINAASPVLEGLVLRGNSASGTGGAIYGVNGSAPWINECVFEDNVAGPQGGAVAALGSDMVLRRCVMTGNTATLGGGGVWASGGSVEIVNSTFVANGAEMGAHIALEDAIDAVVRNVIAVSSVTGSGVWSDGSALVTATYCDVWANSGDWINVVPGVGCIAESPLFLDAESGTLDSTSPCIDAGDPADIPPPGGGDRIDIGAFEFDYGAHTIWVRAGESIQAAVDSAEAGDRVLVEPGTYVENVDLTGRPIELRSVEGPEVTIIDGNALGPVLWIHRGEDASTVVEGFTLQHGLATRGGGLLIEAASPLIRDLIVEDNQAVADGGGVYIRNADASPRLERVLVRNNEALDFGGGISVYRANPVFVWCIVESNQVIGNGGGVRLKESDAVLRNCTIAFNRCDPGGCAGLYVDTGSFPEIRQNIVANNVDGSGIRVIAGAVPDIGYNNSWGNDGANYVGTGGGPGVMSSDPFFAGGEPFDFHLRSTAGYWSGSEWKKASQLSPCIDAGDPLDPWDVEPIPNGRRRNLGAYGGTEEASRTPGHRLEVPTDYGSIAAALAVADAGDTVHVGPVVLNEHVVIDGVAVSLVGDGPDQTVIDGNGLGRCLEIRNVRSGEVEIRGITFRNGDAGSGIGGGILVDSGDPYLTDCVVESSRAQSGGGIGIVDGYPEIEGIRVTNNIAEVAGGGIAWSGGGGVIFRSVFAADSAGVAGGAIYVSNASPEIINCTLDRNRIANLNLGGGIHVEPGGTTTVIKNCSVTETSQGFGFYRDEDAAASVSYCNAYQNWPSGDYKNFGEQRPWGCTSNPPTFTEGDPFYALSRASDLIDAGDPGHPVPYGGGATVDQGAYEYIFRPSRVLEVPFDYGTIDAAIFAAEEGDTVLVYPGIYQENLVLAGLNINLVGLPGGDEVVITGNPAPAGLEQASPLLEVHGLDNAVVRGLVFQNGHGDRGGAVHLQSSSITVEECIFRNNTSTWGGAVYISGGGPLIRGCQFFDNESIGESGGALALGDSTMAEIRNCLIVNNVSSRYAGGIYISGGEPEIVNNTIVSNLSPSHGAGIHMTHRTSARIINNVVVSNRGAAGIYGGVDTLPFMRRNNVWNNEGGNYSVVSPGLGDMQRNPKFVGGDPYDYHLKSEHGSWHDAEAAWVVDDATSPCVDAGLNSEGEDLEEPLPNGGIVNLGFAGGTEFASKSAQAVLLVPEQFASIQSAIMAANEGDQILVSPGTYDGPIDFRGKGVWVRAADGPDSTLIVPTPDLPAVVFRREETPESILDGFQISGGWAVEGAAVYIERAAPTITGCFFSNNEAYGEGGGAIFGYLAMPRIRGNVFQDNIAFAEGGAVLLEASAGIVEDNVFERNRSHFAGGALALTADDDRIDGSTVVRWNHFEDNRGEGTGGGGLYILSATPDIEQNVFVRNQTPFHGAGAYLAGDDTGGMFVGNIFESNEAWSVDAQSRGGGLAFRYSEGRDLVFMNNTMIDNSAMEGSGIFIQHSDARFVNNVFANHRLGAAAHAVGVEPAAGFNDFWQNAGGDLLGIPASPSNLFVDPGFVGDDYDLSDGSLLVDAGHPGLLDKDGSRSDVGARSFGHSLSVTMEPDSLHVNRGGIFGMTVTVENPDLQDQGPVVRRTVVTTPIGGSTFVAHQDTVFVDAMSVHSGRIQGPVPNRANPGEYEIRVEIYVRDVYYDYDSISLDVR